MITDQDMKKLEDKFATKDDLKKAIQENTDQIVTFMSERFSVVIDKLDKCLEELRIHRIILGDYEERIQGLESKIR